MTYHQPQGLPPSENPEETSSMPGEYINVSLPETRPLVTYSLMALTIAVYAGQLLTTYLFGQDVLSLLGAKVNSLIIAGQWWRLLTPMLLHNSILHIAFNMYALYILGPGLERFYGHGRFLALYLLAGLGGNVMSFLLTPNPSLGSSTAIFGLLAAQAVLIYQNRRLWGGRMNRALQNILLVAVINFAIGLSPGIDNWGHLGGFVVGAIFAWFAGPLLEVRIESGTPVLADSRGQGTAIVTAVLLALSIVAAALSVFW